MSKSAAKSCTFGDNVFSHITNYSIKQGGAVTKKLEDLSRVNVIYTGGADETSVSITTTDTDVVAGLKIGDMDDLALVVIAGGLGASALTEKTYTMSNCYVSAIGDISHSNADFGVCEQQVTFELGKAPGASNDPTYGWSA